jgi:hypothetical protein
LKTLVFVTAGGHGHHRLRKLYPVGLLGNDVLHLSQLLLISPHKVMLGFQIGKVFYLALPSVARFFHVI